MPEWDKHLTSTAMRGEILKFQESLWANLIQVGPFFKNQLGGGQDD